MNRKVLLVVISIINGFGNLKTYCQEVTDSLSVKLQEVVVTNRHPASRLEGSTIVTTIPGSTLADIGNALDLLAQLPMIKVEGNSVSVIGKDNIEIYIDGRPMHDSSELQQLLSSNMKRVELNLAPGAAYGSNVSAVLSITTKRNFAKGISVTDQFELQRRRKWTVMDYLGLSYRIKDWEIFTNSSINHNNSLAKGSTINTLIYNGKQTLVGSSQHNSYPTTAGTLKVGFNYAKGHQSFGAYYRFNPEHGDFQNIGREWLDHYPPILRHIDKEVNGHSHLASVYYENNFTENSLIHFDGDFRRSLSDNSVTTGYSGNLYPEVSSTDRRNSTLLAGKLYLKLPVWNGELLLGTQDSHTHTSLDFRMNTAEVGEYIPSSLTDATQTSASLFASWSRRIGRMSLSAGARYEYVDYDYKVDGKRREDLSKRDHLLTPDISLGYAFNESARINMSYKMATVKPPYSQLTGSLSYVGLHEIEGGNPALRDEKMHNVQISGMWKGFILQTDFTRAINTYGYVKQLYPSKDLQLLMHPINIDVSALSMFVVWSSPVRFWTPEVTAGLYRQWLNIEGHNYNKPIVSYYFDNTFSLPGGWIITANMGGRTEGDIHTNRFGATWFTLDASIGKSLLNKSLTLKLEASDIFNTANNNWTMNTYGVRVDKRQSYDNRGITLHVIFNFQPHKSRYKGSSAAESEMKRL